MLIGHQRDCGGFRNVANIDCRYSDESQRIGIHRKFGKRVFERRIVLEEIVWTNNRKWHVKFPDRALNGELGGKVRNVLEMLNAKHRVVNNVRQLEFFCEIVSNEPLRQLIWSDGVEKV